MEHKYEKEIICINNNYKRIDSNNFQNCQILLDLTTGVEYLFVNRAYTMDMESYGAGGMNVRYKADGNIWIANENEMKDICKKYVESIGEPDTVYHFRILGEEYNVKCNLIEQK